MNEFRKVPQDIKSEMALLGHILLNNNILDDLKIKSDDFFKHQHSEIYSNILKLNSENKIADLITLSEIDKEFDVMLYDELTKYAMYSTNYKQYEQNILEKSKLRSYINVLSESIEIAYEGMDPSDNFKKLEELELNNENEMIQISEVTHDTIDYINYLQTKTGYDGLETGLRLLDYKLDGLKKKSFYILAARPSQGKTALALQIANGVAQREKTVAIFSLEMGKIELVKRMIVSESQTHLKLIKDKKLDTKEFQNINKAAQNIHRRNIFIDDEFDQTISRIYRQSKKLKKRKGLDLIIIDYLQLLTPDGKFNSKNEEVGYNSRWLKKIAKNLDVPVICLSQLSRSCEQRADKRPQLSDLRDSGNIEQDADCVMFLYREDYYHQNESDYTPDNIAEILISKNRGGETGTVKTRWNGGMQTFYND